MGFPPDKSDGPWESWSLPKPFTVSESSSIAASSAISSSPNSAYFSSMWKLRLQPERRLGYLMSKGEVGFAFVPRTAASACFRASSYALASLDDLRQESGWDRSQATHQSMQGRMSGRKSILSWMVLASCTGVSWRFARNKEASFCRTAASQSEREK